MTEAANHLSGWGWFCIVLVLLLQGTFLFLDARKLGSYPWFWGVWGLIQFPIPLITYWIVVRKSLFRKKRHR